MCVPVGFHRKGSLFCRMFLEYLYVASGGSKSPDWSSSRILPSHCREGPSPRRLADMLLLIFGFLVKSQTPLILPADSSPCWHHADRDKCRRSHISAVSPRLENALGYSRTPLVRSGHLDDHLHRNLELAGYLDYQRWAECPSSKSCRCLLQRENFLCSCFLAYAHCSLN